MNIEKNIDKFVRSFSFFRFNNLLFVNIVLMIILYFVYNLNEIYEKYNIKYENILEQIYVFMFIFILLFFILPNYLKNYHIMYLEKEYGLYSHFKPINYRNQKKKNIIYI